MTSAADGSIDLGSMLDVLMFGFRRVRERIDDMIDSSHDAEARDRAAASIAVDALVRAMPSTFLDELGTTADALVDLLTSHAAATCERPSLN